MNPCASGWKVTGSFQVGALAWPTETQGCRWEEGWQVVLCGSLSALSRGLQFYLDGVESYLSGVNDS